MENINLRDETSNRISPVVVDLGKKRRKRIRQLKKGKGPLMAEIDHAVQQVKERLGDELEEKKVVPVVLLYRRTKKRRKLSAFNSIMPFKY
jgi:hypothetical protein